MNDIKFYGKSLKLIIKWLKKSYQSTNNNGFSIGFDIRKGWFSPYSETTGYIISTLYRYASLNNEYEYADIATSAADWLILNQNENDINANVSNLFTKV